MNILSQADNLPLELGLQISPDILAAAISQADYELKPNLELAPPPVLEWVGRQELLSSINYRWLEKKTYVVGLIGFGGEGKSSLARRWLDDLWEDNYLDKPQGVLWWDFYKKRNIDEFFRDAITYLSKGRVDFSTLPSADHQAKFLGGMLRAHRYLLILDGLEQAQHSGGDRYGFLKSPDLSEFLNYFAAGNHKSFCLITSRAPVMDLMTYVTYSQLNVNRLTDIDGKELLKKLEVKGSDSQLVELVEKWNGHALTLNLLGNYLVRFCHGKIAFTDKFFKFKDTEKRYERLNQLLRQYDSMLHPDQREFMLKFSVFRYPINQSGIENLFDISLDKINQLVEYRILQFNDLQTFYTSHALIREYYLELLKEDRKKRIKYNEKAANYYLDEAEKINYKKPNLDELLPLIEAIRHLCRAGDYDKAEEIRKKYLPQQEKLTLTKQLAELGAYETELELLREFFNNRDLASLEPKVKSLKEKLSILYQVSQCLSNLGRLIEAIPFSQKYIEITLKRKNDKNDKNQLISKGYRELAKIYGYLGKLEESEKSADKALEYAEKIDYLLGERKSLIYKGFVCFLQNRPETNELFQRSILLAQKEEPNTLYLKGNEGVIHADYLQCSGRLEEARKIIDANLKFENEQNIDDRSRLYRVLGDLEALSGHQEQAKVAYQTALDIARSITHWQALITILSARGYWLAYYQKDVSGALNNLNEALEYAITGGYRIDEVDIRIGLAWAYFNSNQITEASKQAKWAKIISEEIGYYWGQTDAQTILKKI